jgi:uncharacterized membrane protein
MAADSKSKSIAGDKPATVDRVLLGPGAEFWVCLVVVLLLAALVRIPTLGAEDFWLDELHTLINSAANRARFEALLTGVILENVPRYTELGADTTTADVWNGLREDTHPPLYFTFAYAWRRVFGSGEFPLRLMSALFSVLSVVPVALIFREFGRPRAGLAAALLLALSYAHAQMGYQARPYAMSLLLVSFAFWLLVRLERQGATMPTRVRALWLSVYGVTVLAAMLTHYFAGIVLAAQAVYALIRLRGPALRGWLATVAIAAATWCAIWGPTFLAQRQAIRSQEWLLDAAPDHLARTAVRAMELPVRLMLYRPLPDWTRGTVWFPAIVGAALLAILMWAAIARREPAAQLFALWYLLPVAAFTTADLAGGTELLTHLRYGSLAVPALAGLIVAAGDVLKWWTAMGLLLGATVIMTATIRPSAHDNPAALSAARQLAEMTEADDLVVFDATDWPSGWALRGFVLVQHNTPEWRHPVLLLQSAPDGELRRRLMRYKHIAVVSPRLAADPNPCPSSHARAFRTKHIPGIGWLYRFDRIAARSHTASHSRPQTPCLDRHPLPTSCPRCSVRRLQGDEADAQIANGDLSVASGVDHQPEEPRSSENEIARGQ